MVQAVIATTVTGLQGRQVAATPAPTNNQALTWNGSAWVPAGPFLTAAGAPYIAQNYVDNSGFIINQRAYASGSALAAGAYGLDRWKAGASGCTLTFTYSPASTLVTIAAGTLQQVVEGINFFNTQYTLSWLGSATGRVGTGAYVASPITFTGAANTNTTIEFQGGTLGQVQLQVGTQATQWQPNTFQVELARCQRFYSTDQAYCVGNAPGGGTAIGATFKFSVPMRTSPTVTPVSSNWGTGGGGTSIIAQIATTSFILNVNTPGAGQFGANSSYTASADL